MSIIVLPGAQDDLLQLKRYMLSKWGKAMWDKAEKELFDKFSAADANPGIGKPVPELADLEITDFRQILTSHHKIVYETDSGVTYIHIVANFNQDVQSLLTRRILPA